MQLKHDTEMYKFESELSSNLDSNTGELVPAGSSVRVLRTINVGKDEHGNSCYQSFIQSPDSRQVVDGTEVRFAYVGMDEIEP